MSTTIAALVERLAQQSTPALSWISETGNLDLTGTVCANWTYKSADLLGAEGVGADSTDLLIATPGYLHWRALTPALAAWALGATVHLRKPADEPPSQPHIALAPEALAGADVLDEAEDVFVYAEAPLALSAAAPAGCRDFNSEIRAHPDVIPLPAHDALRLSLGGSAAEEAALPSAADALQRPGLLELAGLPVSAQQAAQVITALAGRGIVVSDQADSARRSGLVTAVAEVSETVGSWTQLRPAD